MKQSYSKNIFSRIYKSYNYGFYRKYEAVKKIRGATRLNEFLRSLAARRVSKISQEPQGIFEEEWDNLIVIDGCRHDLYEEVTSIAKSRISLGSSSNNFVERNFSEGDHSDIVYVTANPHIDPFEENAKNYFYELTGRKPSETFFEIFYTYLTDWNDDKGTVLADKVVRDAQTAEKLFSDKKKIIHFMQPHHPFVTSDLEARGFDQELNPDKDDNMSIWVKCERGLVSREEAWEAYKQNLEYVLDEIDVLTQNLEGKTVITADHGNLVGEGGLYGHPGNKDYLPLRKVPWDVVQEE